MTIADVIVLITSNIKIIKASYKFNSLQYYLCERNGGLCYLSGNDLLDIAVESVK